MLSKNCSSLFWNKQNSYVNHLKRFNEKSYTLKPLRETEGYTPIKRDVDKEAKPLNPLPLNFDEDVIFLDEKKMRFTVRALDDSTTNTLGR